MLVALYLTVMKKQSNWQTRFNLATFCACRHIRTGIFICIWRGCFVCVQWFVVRCICSFCWMLNCWPSLHVPKHYFSYWIYTFSIKGIGIYTHVYGIFFIPVALNVNVKEEIKCDKGRKILKSSSEKIHSKLRNSIVVNYSE